MVSTKTNTPTNNMACVSNAQVGVKYALIQGLKAVPNVSNLKGCTTINKS
jgi:hypothetical protein